MEDIFTYVGRCASYTLNYFWWGVDCFVNLYSGIFGC